MCIYTHIQRVLYCKSAKASIILEKLRKSPVNVNHPKSLITKQSYYATSLRRIDRMKQEIWISWEIRILILTSLMFQAVLSFLAPYRKRTTGAVFGISLWLIYLSADAIALFTIGLISRSHGDRTVLNCELLAFWAPILLLHLGGPDTITALAVEDNELWLRHAFQLAVQGVVTLYVFQQSYREDKGSQLWVPTGIMFIIGLIKYFERIHALFLASSDTFRENSRSMMGECDDPHQSPDIVDQDLSDKVAAYRLYNMYKYLLVDGFLTVYRRDTSRNFLLAVDSNRGLKIIQIELNLIYDLFYTKAILLSSKNFVRSCCSLSLAVSLLMFVISEKSGYHEIDVQVTYTLLAGAMLLDFYATINLVISDWRSILPSLVSHKNTVTNSLSPKLLQWVTWVTGTSRWSESICQYSLLTKRSNNLRQCLKNIRIPRLRDMLIGWYYVDEIPIDQSLVSFVIDELYKFGHQAAINEQKYQEIWSARGDLALKDYTTRFLNNDIYDSSGYYTRDVEYEVSVFTWHLATDICYWSSIEQHNDIDDDDEVRYRCHSRQLSNYMSYILQKQRAMVSSVAVLTDLLVEDTILDFKGYFISAHRTSDWYREGTDDEFLHQLSVELLTRRADFGHSDLRQGTRSVLFDACRLALKLKEFGARQWEVTSKVWVELLCYAAVRSSPRSHISKLNKGGEFFTIVWLLMAHLGLGERLQLHNLKIAKDLTVDEVDAFRRENMWT